MSCCYGSSTRTKTTTKWVREPASKGTTGSKWLGNYGMERKEAHYQVEAKEGGKGRSDKRGGSKEKSDPERWGSAACRTGGTRVVGGL